MSAENTTSHQEILTREEVADYLRVPLATVDYWVRRQEIPFSRVGSRAVRFSRKRLLEWFDSREGIAAPMVKRAAEQG